jgi:hypothetical protein
MRTQEDYEILKLLKQILAEVQETNAVVKEVKLWKKFIFWAFGIAMTGAGLWDLLDRIRSIR